jgi:hypothetical protein
MSKLIVEINLDSADARDPDPHAEDPQPYGPAIARYLRDAANQIEEGATKGGIRDVVHKIGDFRITRGTYIVRETR